jgi:hypothetical protein
MLCRAFLKKIPHWQGPFLFGVGGSRLMPLINNPHHGRVKYPLVDYHDFCVFTQLSSSGVEREVMCE